MSETRRVSDSYTDLWNIQRHGRRIIRVNHAVRPNPMEWYGKSDRCCRISLCDVPIGTGLLACPKALSGLGRKLLVDQLVQSRTRFRTIAPMISGDGQHQYSYTYNIIVKRPPSILRLHPFHTTRDNDSVVGPPGLGSTLLPS